MRIQVKLMLNKNKINNCQIKIKTETEYLNYNVKAFQSIDKKIKKKHKKNNKQSAKPLQLAKICLRTFYENAFKWNIFISLLLNKGL